MKQEILEDLVSQKILLQDMNLTLKKHLDGLETNFPFISDCDISSARDLYDGQDLRDIACGHKRVHDNIPSLSCPKVAICNILCVTHILLQFYTKVLT
jgi:hypothetical protein